MDRQDKDLLRILRIESGALPPPQEFAPLRAAPLVKLMGAALCLGAIGVGGFLLLASHRASTDIETLTRPPTHGMIAPKRPPRFDRGTAQSPDRAITSNPAQTSGRGSLKPGRRVLADAGRGAVVPPDVLSELGRSARPSKAARSAKVEAHRAASGSRSPARTGPGDQKTNDDLDALDALKLLHQK